MSIDSPTTFLVFEDGSGMAGFIDIETPAELGERLAKMGGGAGMVFVECAASVPASRAEKAIWPDEADEVLAQLKAAREASGGRYRSFSR